MSALLSFVLVLLVGVAQILALEVTPESPCAAYCLDSAEGNTADANDSSTNATDLTCRDVSYSTSDTGIKYKNCMECLQQSTKVDGHQSDLKWFICKRQEPPTLTPEPFPELTRSQTT